MRDLLRAIFSRWLTALLIVAMVVGAAAAATFLLPKVYEAEARLTAPLTPGEQNLSGNINVDTTWEVRLKLLHDVLTGDQVLARVVVKDLLDRGFGAVSAKEVLASHQDDLRQLRKNVRMEVVSGQTTGKSLSFSIYVRAESAERSKKLTDWVVAEFTTAYHSLLKDELKARYDAASKGLADMISDPDGIYLKTRRQYTELVDTFPNLADLATALSLQGEGPIANVGTSQTQARFMEEGIALNSQLEGDRVLIEQLKAAISVFDGEISGVGDVEKFPFVPTGLRDQPAITRISENLANKLSTRAQFRSVYTDTYQPLVALGAEIRSLERELLALFRTDLTALEAEKAASEAKLKPYTDYLGPKKLSEPAPKYDKLGDTLAALGEATTNWKSQKRWAEEQENRVQQTLRDLNEASAAPPLRVLDMANTPELPVRPIVWLNLALGVLVGLLLALAYVFLADHYDHSVRSTDDVERYLGVPVLASVGRVGANAIKAG